jgi:L-alanine-DL-glutamate epimerase-like enolase superfamily enzyme
LVEYLTGSLFIRDLVEVPWKLDSKGMLLIPEGTGLGISLDIDDMEKHSGQRF